MNINTGWKFGEEQGIHLVLDYLPIKYLLFTINMINLLTNFTVENLASITLTKSRVTSSVTNGMRHLSSSPDKMHQEYSILLVLFLAKVKIHTGALSKPKQSDILQSNWPTSKMSKIWKTRRDCPDGSRRNDSQIQDPRFNLGFKRALLGQQAKREWSLCMRWCYWLQLLLDWWLVTRWLFMKKYPSF